MMVRLFCYGYGYSALALARRLSGGGERGDGFRVCGTTRSDRRARAFDGPGRLILQDDDCGFDETVDEELRACTHLLVSASPDQRGDPLLRLHGETLRASQNLVWVGYLSTIGVYGDQGNAWIDEDTAVAPNSQRAKRRVVAEREWLGFGEQSGLRVQVFRLAGIYGPGRSVIDKLMAGSARRIVKPGQVFNRIHVDDIAAVVEVALSGAGSRPVYNVSDDEPAPPQDVVAYGAELLGIAPPPLVAFEDAELSSMGRSFYGEQRRVGNRLIKADLGVKLQFPTYREGLGAIAGDVGSR